MSNRIIAQGNYRPAKRFGALIYTAGMTPRVNGTLIATGKITSEEPFSTWKDAVRQAAANALSAAHSVLEEGESIGGILNMFVFLNTADDFTNHAKIADFASEYLTEQLGDNGIGSRTAIGVKTLPGNSPVEIQLIAFAQ